LRYLTPEGLFRLKRRIFSVAFQHAGDDQSDHLSVVSETCPTC